MKRFHSIEETSVVRVRVVIYLKVLVERWAEGEREGGSSTDSYYVDGRGIGWVELFVNGEGFDVRCETGERS